MTAETWGAAGSAGDLMFGLVVLTFSLTGLLVLRRQPRNAVGWLLHSIGLVWGLSGFVDSYATYGLLVDPGSLPGPDVAAALNEGAWALGIGLMGTFLILLFPDGRLPTPRWRPLAWLCGVTIVMVTVVVDLLPGRLEESAVPTLENPIAVEAAERCSTRRWSCSCRCCRCAFSRAPSAWSVDSAAHAAWSASS